MFPVLGTWVPPQSSTEEGHGAHLAGFGNGYTAPFVAGHGLTHALVGQMLNLANFFGSKFLEVAEVEAQYIGRYKGAFLLHVCTQHFAQGLVQQVGGAVVARGGHAGFGVDCRAEVG